MFDGPEDQNGLRNADEIRLWVHLLNGALGPVPDAPFVLMGGANLDPDRGEGRRHVIASLLADTRLQDPLAESGPTVDWREPRPGDLRVDYLLPSADIRVLEAGVFWPKAPDPDARLLVFNKVRASRHHMVWADIEF
ncbi:endonuclease/exonuclease/phosphatase family protein [Shimia sp. MMG029]|uniref:endonuclease/exonuclease/phosphatase family protein n=1 Tax=Shimia sp. MMG029 TaxID=3021978 RepID=UPI003F8DB5C3